MVQKFLFVILFLFIFVISINAQSINLGADTAMGSCKSCITLRVKINNPNPSTADYTVDSIPYNISYSFQGDSLLHYDFTNGGVNLVTNGTVSDTIDLPFNFCFFNNTYNKCVVGGGGYINFNINFANTGLPSSGYNINFPNNYLNFQNCIFCPLGGYNDTINSSAISPYGSLKITYQTYGVAPNRAFVVSWKNMGYNQPTFFCDTFWNNTHQIILYEGTYKIGNNILHREDCHGYLNINYAQQGITDNTGTKAVMVPGRNGNVFWGADHESWVYTPNDHTTEWYDVNNNLLATGVDSLQVCPTTAVSTYYVKSLLAQCGGGSVWVSDTITITKLGAMAINNVVTTNPACFGYTNGHIQFSVLNAVAPLSYTINNNATPTNNIQNLSAGTYTIQATDAQGCTASTIITLTDPNPIDLQIISQTDIVCKGDKNATLTLAATGGISPYQYSSSQTTWSTNPLLQNLSAGIILCTVKDANNCQDTMSTTLIEPQTALSISTQITNRNDCKQDKVGHVETSVQGGNAPYTYLWNTIPPTYYNVLQFAENGTYQVTVTDATGCAQTATVSLTPTLHCELQIPNAFTPNGDNLNETFRIKDYCGGIISYQIKIFNRWGNMVYSSRDFTQGWDGKYNGTMQSNDVFTYYIEYNCQENKETKTYLQKGEVILIR